MPPANRKSAVFTATCEPLEEVEHLRIEAKRDEIAQAASENRMLGERCHHLEREAAKTDDPTARKSKEDEAISLTQELAVLKVPAQPRLIAADATPEALASLLAEQGGRMCLFSPEGDMFDMLAGRYNNGAPSFDVILKSHCGDTLRVDRRGRSEYVEKPALTIALTVQPDVIRGLVDKPGFRGRGLLGRFLYSMPESTVGRRRIDPEPLSDVVRHKYKDYIKALAKPEHSQDASDLPVTQMLYLTGETNAVLREFEIELEPQLAEDGALGMMADWAGKLAGAIVRIAGILHLTEHVQNLARWPERISADTMKRAISIGYYFISHAQAAYNEMGADPQIEKAKHLLRWVEKIGGSSFSKRDAHQALKGRFKKVSDIEPLLELLESHGYIRARVDTAHGRAGRKPSQAYDVNPSGFSTSHNSHNPQNSGARRVSEDSGNSEDKDDFEHRDPPDKEVRLIQDETTTRERIRI